MMDGARIRRQIFGEKVFEESASSALGIFPLGRNVLTLLALVRFGRPVCREFGAGFQEFDFVAEDMRGFVE